MTAALSFLRGQTFHRRWTPYDRSFRYGVTLIDVDIDRLDEANRSSRWFSIDKQNAMSFRTSGHGPRDGSSLRVWAETQFASIGVTPAQLETIRLVTFPRLLGYAFAPLSLWIGWTREGAHLGTIYEVHNTFGEAHSYVVPARDRTDDDLVAPKRFHVSPFFDIVGDYRFRLEVGETSLRVSVTNVVDGKTTHYANIRAKRHPVSDLAILQNLVQAPFSSFGVTLGIHWEALQIWRRGARYHSRPPLPDLPATLARPLSRER